MYICCNWRDSHFLQIFTQKHHSPLPLFIIFLLFLLSLFSKTFWYMTKINYFCHRIIIDFTSGIFKLFFVWIQIDLLLYHNFQNFFSKSSFFFLSGFCLFNLFFLFLFSCVLAIKIIKLCIFFLLVLHYIIVVTFLLYKNYVDFKSILNPFSDFKNICSCLFLVFCIGGFLFPFLFQFFSWILNDFIYVTHIHFVSKETNYFNWKFYFKYFFGDFCLRKKNL